jgi:hypothetical protein
MEMITTKCRRKGQALNFNKLGGLDILLMGW